MVLEDDGCDARTLSPPEISSSYTPLPTRWVDGGGEDILEHDGRDTDDAGAELELGLTLGAGLASFKANAAPWGGYCRIRTANDFPSAAPPSASTVRHHRPVNASPGCDAVADNGSNASSPVVGWPPLRSFRINSLFNQCKENGGSSSDEERVGTDRKTTATTNPIKEKKADVVGDGGFNKRTGAAVPVTIKASHEKRRPGSLFVKVKMDGIPIGRKVNLSAQRSYDALALALEDMFEAPTTRNKHDSSKASSLLDGSSEFVLTYEDKDGDWMLVGDVPWRMFVGTARRLRIMRTSDANGLATSFQPSMAGLRSQRSR